MKRTAEQIWERYQKALGEKAKWDTLYEDVYKYGMPGRYNTTRAVGVRGQSAGKSEREEIFSSVMEQSCDRFVQRVQSILTPVGVDWIDFEAGYLFKKQQNPEIDTQLAEIKNVLNVYKDTSNFDSVITEAYYDLIAGTMCMSLIEGNEYDPLRFVAIPIKDIAIEEGLFSEVCTVYRKLKMRADLVKKQFQDAKWQSEDPENEVNLIECTYKDYDTEEWRYNILDEKNRQVIVERVYKTSPFIVLRWAKCAGETYGRGLGLKAIADVKTLNRLTEYTLRALAFTIPVFLAQSTDNYDPTVFQMVPGAINPVPSTATNNPTITQLGINQQPDMSQFEAEKLEMNIKRCLLDDTIPNDPNRNLTATEITHRAQELKNNFSNSFGRIMTEFMYPLIRRMIEVLQKFGYVSDAFDPRAFNGYGYKIKINTLLANGQKQEEVQNTLNVLQMFQSLDPTNELVGMVLKLDQLIPDLLKKMGLDPKFINTTEEIQKAQALRAQAVQEMAAAEEMQNEANE